MKCPNCGQWNRASLPKCFKCGTPLPLAERFSATQPVEALEESIQKTQEVAAVQYKIDESGNEIPKEDPKDRLALEMRSYHERKKRGEERQRQLRKTSSRRGFSVDNEESEQFFPSQSGYDPYGLSQHVDYDGFTDSPTYYGTGEDFNANIRQRATGSYKFQKKSFRRSTTFGLRRILPILAVLLFLAGLVIAGYFFILRPYLEKKNTIPEELQPKITASILGEAAAHTIRIPATEGAQIYIKELRKSFMAVGGYASFQVPDYFWYELKEEDPKDKDTWLPETMEVSLTPYIRTETNEQVAMPLVKYTIDIPQSPLLLINPSTLYTETSMPLYNIKFQVMTNSQVFINGEEYSSFVNTQDGLITYNAPIHPIGENKIVITVRSQYYRMNTTTITIYRAVQDIPLDLAATLDDESSLDRMPIFATTRAGATIKVLTPHTKLDTSKLDSTGEFSFDATFEHFGNNTIRIQADYPGKQSTIIEYNVYYLPTPNIYTTRAWALNDGFGYPDLLANLSKRVEKTQVYVMTGVALESISERPQLMIFDVSDGKTGGELPVLLENQSKTTWEVGKRYKIYGEAYGMYNNMPRLIARYTYQPKE
ncbi:MAG: hypothetical protein Q4E07_06505 [Eubacteriales bacterium]|nr:hypothetical protein [Eubacteriales bacterium]